MEMGKEERREEMREAVNEDEKEERIRENGIVEKT